MGSGMILGMVIVIPLVFCAAVLLMASDKWLKDFAELARSLGRPM
jgi:hypothetical protein